MENHLQMPAAEPNGFVKTLNNMGYMTSTLDPYSQAFVDFAKEAPGPLLDVGAAYGVASMAALPKAALLYANDVCEDHLKILADRVPALHREKLRLVPGEFPGGFDFEPGSLGAVLVARVVHFFTGEKIEESFLAVRRWLAPGGKLFLVAETPYLRNFQNFIPVYEDRKSRGELWPGLVTNVSEIAPDRGKALPSMIHFMDVDVLSRIALQSGFDVERCSTIARKDFPEDLQWDGRESVGIIAVKRG